MKLIDVVRGRAPDKVRSDGSDLFYNQLHYQLGGLGISNTLNGAEIEEIDSSYEAYAQRVYKRNGPVFACIALRTRVFAEPRFAWQTRAEGRPQSMFTDSRLARLERPWPGGTTQDLMQRLLMSADLGGNAYVTINKHGHLRILRPDWMTIVRGGDNAADDDPDGIDATLLGYVYKPGGPGSKSRPQGLFPDEVAHFAPDPDPEAMFRGMSWITPVIREILGDGAMSDHKNKFLENAATPNLVVRLDASVTPEEFREFREEAEKLHRGVENAYKTMYLGGGADVTVTGSDLKELDFKVVQGHGETRIAMAAGVHPVVVGMSEGMQGSSLNAGNYSQARRNVADTTFWPLWRNAAGSLSTLLEAGDGAELVADTRDVPFLRSDEGDAAKVQNQRASTIASLISSGFTPESAVLAVGTGDFGKLEHTGLVSVQLQKPGSGDQGSDEGVGDDGGEN